MSAPLSRSWSWVSAGPWDCWGRYCRARAACRAQGAGWDTGCRSLRPGWWTDTGGPAASGPAAGGICQDSPGGTAPGGRRVKEKKWTLAWIGQEVQGDLGLFCKRKKERKCGQSQSWIETLNGRTASEKRKIAFVSNFPFSILLCHRFLHSIRWCYNMLVSMAKKETKKKKCTTLIKAGL